MEVKLTDLKETTRPLSDLRPYPEEKPIGFYDTDNKFMLVVMDQGTVKKKRVKNDHFNKDLTVN